MKRLFRTNGRFDVRVKVFWSLRHEIVLKIARPNFEATNYRTQVLNAS